MISSFRRRRDSEREELDELLSAYLDGELTESEQADLDARLSRDPALRSELRAMHRTVSLLRELPSVAPPRNFLLTPSMVKGRRVEVGTPAARREPRMRAWMAPVLTAATAVVSLLFAVVLVGDMLLPGIGGLASSPAPLQQMEAPQEVVLETLTADEVEAPDQERAAEVEALREPTSPAQLEAEAEKVAEEEMPEDEEPDVAATQVAATRAAEAPPGAGATPPPVGEDLTAEEVTASASESISPTVTVTEDAATAIPRERPDPAEGELEQASPPSGDVELAPRAEWALGEAALSRLSPRGWIALEIALGAASLGLAVVTIRAWRRRRKDRG